MLTVVISHFVRMAQQTVDHSPMVLTDAIEVIECTWVCELDNQIKFTEEALETILGVPRVSLHTVLKGYVDWTKENNVELITAEHMQIINDIRSKEKNKK